MKPSRPCARRTSAPTVSALLGASALLAASALAGPAAIAATPASSASQTNQASPQVLVVPVTGTIEHGLAPFVERSLATAARDEASAVILDIDTPGGRVDAAQRIVDAITESEVPVFAFVNRRAFSAGAMIALATEGVRMRPGSVIGAATPVLGTEKAPEKYVSAMRSEMRAIAETRGLDPDIAEAMVDESIEVAGIIEEGKLLTLTTEEAVEVGYAQAVEDLDALLADLELGDAEVVPMEVNWAEHFVRFLANPAITSLLLSIGILGLLTEIKTPGLGLAGAAGVVALALFFGSHLILGLAGIEDVLIFVAGLVLIAVEIFVVPGFGVFGILGLLGVAAGLYMGLLGSLPLAVDFTRAGMILSAVLLLIVVAGGVLLYVLPGNPTLLRRSIFLGRRMDRSIGFESQHVRSELVGRRGQAVTDLRPSGTALINGERIDVVSESEWIEAGTQVEVTSAEGYRQIVRPVARDRVPAESNPSD